MFEKFFKRNNPSEICLDKLEITDKVKERQMITAELIKKQSVQQIALASCSCNPECSADDCSHYGNKVTFTAWARVPAGYKLVTAFPEFMYNTSCLKCLVESCNLPNISVVNPCDGTMIKGCSVKLKKIRLLGCLKYYVDIGYATGNPGGGFAYPGNEGVQCIDQIIRYTCDCETVCPETIGIGYSLSTGAPSPQPNGDTLVPIKVTLTFTV